MKKRHPFAIVECHNQRKPNVLRVSRYRVRIESIGSDVLRFKASWKFPSPATMLSYFVEGRRVVIEEAGFAKKDSLFEYYGRFVDDNG
jgi:hypothetical protein